MNAQIGDTWYRYEDVVYAARRDEFDNPIGPSSIEVELRTFKVEKVTPKGVRLDNGRFVNGSSTKRYACPSVSQAITSFVARKKAQLLILHAKIHQVEVALRKVAE